MKTEIPVINLETFLNGVDKETVVRQVADACKGIGFLVVSGHSVPDETINSLFDAIVRFFALPPEIKMKTRPTEMGVFRGYSPPAKKSLARSMGAEALPDLREGFSTGRVQEKTDPYFQSPAAGKIFAGNIWPSEADVPGFRYGYVAYYLAMENLATTLMRIFALALDLPETFFLNKIDRHCSNMVAYHYPPIRQAPPIGQVRGGAHTDFGSLSILRAHPSVKGLQILSADEWIDVPNIPGTFIVNLGDLMAQWTNDLWVSTMHRVVNPPEDEWEKPRYSVAFFHQPNYDVLIESLDKKAAPKYAPITSGEHNMRKLSAMAGGH